MTVENQRDIDGVLNAGQVVACVRDAMLCAVEPGMTTAELDKLGGELLDRFGAKSAPRVTYSFPGATCISINEEAAHGIPGHRVIQAGDIVNVDVSAQLDGYFADTGGTIVVPPVARVCYTFGIRQYGERRTPMRTLAQKPKGTQQTTSAKPTTPGRANLGQSGEVSFILALQRTIGNQAVQRLLEANTEHVEGDSATTRTARFGHDFSCIPVYAKGPTIQAKLAVNTPGDVYEQEADRIAEQVMATPASTAVSGAPLRIQRFSEQLDGQVIAPPTSVDQTLASPGRPLEPALRKDMETRFGHDFSRVRVHCNAAAERSAQDVNAAAYTVGHSVVFGAGRFAPGTHEGRRLIAHELAHVVQQSDAALASSPTPMLARSPSGAADAGRAAAQAELDRVLEVARDLIEEQLGERPAKEASPAAIQNTLRRIWGRSRNQVGEAAQRIAEAARDLASQIQEARNRLNFNRVPAVPQVKTSGKHLPEAKTAVKAAVKAEAKLGSRVLAGAGRVGLSLLLPGPQDAIMLMAQFAGSYEEAWEIIEQRNTRRGIAMGIAAGMIGLDWEWVQQNVWRRFATPDVATHVIAAVGKAERSYNDGLARGYKYGAAHAQGMKNSILGEAFAILAREGYQTDEEGLFSINTVARLARVLMPIADDFLRQAAERKEARERREERQRREARGSVGFKV